MLERLSMPVGSQVALSGPALAVFAAQEVVGLRDVGNAHVCAVIVDLFSGAERDDAKQHDLGETGGVFERARGFRFAFGGVHPVHFVLFVFDAGQLLRRLAVGIVERFGQQAGLHSVGVVEQFAFAADEQSAAAFVQVFVAQFFGLVGHKAAVVPGQFYGWHGAACGKLVKGLRSVRVGNAVERCGG